MAGDIGGAAEWLIIGIVLVAAVLGVMLALSNTVILVAGAIVGASGSILTDEMAKAMN